MSVVQKTFREMEAVAKRQDYILVAFSGGKDSVAVLDICAKTFPRVQAFFKYICPGLEVLERQMRFAKERYNVEVFQFPSNGCVEALAEGLWCDPMMELEVDSIPLKHSFAYALDVAKCDLMATGMKDADGLKRRQFFANIRDGKDPFWNKVIHPLREWTKKDVMDYIAVNNLQLPDAQEGKVTNGVGLNHDSICWLHDSHPEDFKKLLRWYPYAGAAVKRREWYGVV